MKLNKENDFLSIPETSDHRFCVGKYGIQKILQTKDKKTEFVCWEDGTCIVAVYSSYHYTAYYPIDDVAPSKRIKAVLMDLDGTTVYSEEFWIEIIRLSMAQLMENDRFSFDESDIPFVSGHSVSEHLDYCIKKYCPSKQLRNAMGLYYDITHRKMNDIIEGKTNNRDFTPAPYLKEFLSFLKQRHIKIGLVTSGLYEKAYPEIFSACSTLGLGKPENVYDSIITAGYPLTKNSCGTLGEISAKPHPWLYLETTLVGLGIDAKERGAVLGIEDSGAGVCALRLAGIPTIGMTNGNIEKSGLSSLCIKMCNSLNDVLDLILRNEELL